MELITSRTNARIKRAARLLSEKSERDASGLFVAEGARLCMEAVQSGVRIAEAYVTAEALSKYDEARVLLEKADLAFEVSREAAAKLADTKASQGIFALCRKPMREGADVIDENARYLLLSSVRDPGNVGTIIRTAEAFDLDGVFLSSDCPDVYSPKVLRATMGGVFRLRIWTASDIPGKITELRAKGVVVYAAAADASYGSMPAFEKNGAYAVVLGNEGSGLSKEIIGFCNGVASIPMAGRAESLGVAMAAGIFAWEMAR